jgi:O-antigen/teichoic acid export membrane protein
MIIGDKNIYKLTMYSGFLKTLISSLIGVISIPLTLKYLGTDKFGVWSLINSVVIFFGISNLGLNSAVSILMNKTSDYLFKMKILKNSIKVLFVVTPVLLLMLIIFHNIHPNWIIFFNAPKLLENEAKCAAMIMIIFSILQTPFTLISSAINGYQKNYIENIFGIISSFIILICIVVVIQMKKDLIYLSLLISLLNLVLNIFKTLYFKYFIVQKNNTNTGKNEDPNINYSYKLILTTGYRAMLGGIASMLVLNMDNIVITNYLGVSYVTSFSITFKLYTIIFSLIFVFNSALVPLIGINVHDNGNIKKIYNKSLILITIIGGLCWVGTFAFGKALIFSWVGSEGYAGTMALFFLGAYSYVFSIVNLNYVLINTLNHLKNIVYITMLEGLLNLFFSIFLGIKFGLVGIAAGTFLGTFLAPFIIFPIVLKKRTNNVIVQNNSFILKHFLVAVLPVIIVSFFINQIQGRIFTVFLLTVIICLIYLFISYLILAKEKIEIKSLLKIHRM